MDKPSDEPEPAHLSLSELIRATRAELERLDKLEPRRTGDESGLRYTLTKLVDALEALEARSMLTKLVEALDARLEARSMDRFFLPK